MIKMMIATAAAMTLIGAAGAQMTAGNSSAMQSGSMSTSSGKMPAKHMMTHKKTMHKKAMHRKTMPNTDSSMGSSNGDSPTGNNM